METQQYDKALVQIYENSAEAGAAAAAELAELLREAVAARGRASVIMATGNSQLSLYEALRGLPDVPWGRVSVFHMDEYIGMAEDHPQSFRRYMREKLVDTVRPAAFFGIAGDAPDVGAELSRYTQLLEEHNPDVCVLGIGENGHLAFNDPPADFDESRLAKVVTLIESARQQQVNEGHFPDLASTPARAITLTIRALLRPAHVLALVPEARKAEPVRRSLEEQVSPDMPGSILRTHEGVTIYLDRSSAGLLGRRHSR
jgi:glucosamine-6-phosphate deaminase